MTLSTLGIHDFCLWRRCKRVEQTGWLCLEPVRAPSLYSGAALCTFKRSAYLCDNTTSATVYKNLYANMHWQHIKNMKSLPLPGPGCLSQALFLSLSLSLSLCLPLFLANSNSCLSSDKKTKTFRPLGPSLMLRSAAVSRTCV